MGTKLESHLQLVLLDKPISQQGNVLCRNPPVFSYHFSVMSHFREAGGNGIYVLMALTVIKCPPSGRYIYFGLEIFAIYYCKD